MVEIYPLMCNRGFRDPSAYVQGSPKVGKGTVIWKWSYIRDTAVIGDDCQIGSWVYIDLGVTIGDRVKIQNKVEVYDGCTIEDDVFIGPGVTFTNVVNPRAFIDRRDEFKPTLVKHHASIGAGAVILCGVTIGEYALVGAGAVITKDVPPYHRILCRQNHDIAVVLPCGCHPVEAEGNILYCPQCKKQYIWKDNLETLEEI